MKRKFEKNISVESDLCRENEKNKKIGQDKEIKSNKLFSTAQEKQTAIVIVVCAKKQDDWARKEEEIVRLAQSAGLQVVARFGQNIRDFSRATVLGSGKLDEIKSAVLSMEKTPDVAIVDYALTGSQAKNISEILGIRVVDRVGLIIDIFATRAQTNEAKLQVKYAQNQYLLPRLSDMQGSFGRFGGSGVGMRGPGETKLELDRRKIEKENIFIKKQLEKVKNQRILTKKNRSHEFKIALVGYTNAGKSSLLNTLTKENIYADDRLFATLDTTTRRLYLGDGKNAVITDTVGFISDLPHQLVEAFSSTLEEAKEADLILHVVDASMKNKNGEFDWKKYAEVTDKVLQDLKATKNRILVLNKADLLQEREPLQENQVYISTVTGEGVKQLLELIAQKVKKE